MLVNHSSIGCVSVSIDKYPLNIGKHWLNIGLTV